MKRISVLFFILSFLSSDCKKGDPFFKSLPKEFVYERIENISSARLFTDGKEIYDDEIISNFVEKIEVFK